MFVNAVHKLLRLSFEAWVRQPSYQDQQTGVGQEFTTRLQAVFSKRVVVWHQTDQTSQDNVFLMVVNFPKKPHVDYSQKDWMPAFVRPSQPHRQSSHEDTIVFT